MLFLLPFIVAGGMLSFYFLGGASDYCYDSGIISLPLSFLQWEGAGMLVCGAFVLLLLSYLLFFIAGRYKFLSAATILPAIIYSFLSLGILCKYGLNNYLIASFLLAFAIARLQSAIVYIQSNASIFDFGLLIMFAVLLAPKLVMLLPWAIVVLPFSGRATMKDIVALFIGFSTALLFTASYYYLTDGWEVLSARIFPLFTGEITFIETFRQQPAIFIILVALILAAMFQSVRHTTTSTVAQRRGLLAMFSLTFFLGISIFFIPIACRGFLFVFFVPLTYLYAYYFIAERSKWIGNAFFVLFLVVCVLLML